MIQITKTDFMTFQDAPMHLWASKHQALENTEPSLFQQHLSRQGYAAERVARQVLEEMFGDRLVWQPVFEDGIFVARGDAAVVEDGICDIYEIKSSTGIEKKHLYDAAFQTLVCEATQQVRNVYLVHLNPDYVHQDEGTNLFVIVNITTDVRSLMVKVEELRRHALAVVEQDTPHKIETCTRPKNCPCQNLCHPNLPEHSIYTIPRIHRRLPELKEKGILAIDDIPNSVKLSKKQRAYVKAVKAGEPNINRKRIRRFLDQLEFPLCFLDYETFNSSIPLYEGYNPYQHMVFQYSLHILSGSAEKMEHYEFVATGEGDPSYSTASHLVGHMPESGSILVWNQMFEMGRNEEMGRLYPEYKRFFDEVNNRIVDLADPFKDGDYVHPDFKGSWSIKAVLPVLVPELSYDELVIGKGDQAMMAWWDMVNADEVDEGVLDALLAYCKLDTLAMVGIWRRLDLDCK